MDTASRFVTRRRFIAMAGACAATAAVSDSLSNGLIAQAATYTPGTYTGVGAGREGDITVEVTVDESSILSVEVVSQHETPGTSDPAFEQVPDAIVAAQSPDVDVASGASISSRGIMDAVRDALAQASGESEGPAERSTSADVIVIGAGAAGLAAAASAAEAGKSVIVLEAAGQPGGATLASSGFFLRLDDTYNAGLERNDDEVASYQDIDGSALPEPWASDFATLQMQVSDYLADSTRTGRFDSLECALVDHYLRGAGSDRDGNAVSLDYDTIRASFQANGDILSWLAEDGFALTDKFVESRSPKGGKVSHVMQPQGGSSALVSALQTKAERLGCDIQAGVRARGLAVQGGRVCGVRATDGDGNQIDYQAAKGVVISTGSFSANTSLASLYQTIGSGLSSDCGSTNPPQNAGDGLVMAQRSGARSRDLQFMATMVRPYHVGGTTGEANNVIGAAQLAVNANARRFADDGDASAIQKALPNQKDGVAFLVGDAAMADALEEKTAGCIDDFAARGWLFQADTLAEAAQAAGLDTDALTLTVEAFNKTVEAGADEAFGRTAFNGAVENRPFIVAKIQVCYHLTFGGLVIDGEARVLDGDGKPVEGLFAAGSVLSGFEGAAHQTGDCLNYVVYTGRMAGQNA